MKDNENKEIETVKQVTRKKRQKSTEKKKNKIKQMQAEGTIQLAFSDISKAVVQISFN